MRTSWLLLPVTLYIATCRAPVQTKEAGQVNAPVREMPTLTLEKVPPPSAIVPRSRSWSHVTVRGLRTLAETLAVAVAAPAGAAKQATQRKASTAVNHR